MVNLGKISTHKITSTTCTDTDVAIAPNLNLFSPVLNNLQMNINSNISMIPVIYHNIINDIHLGDHDQHPEKLPLGLSMKEKHIHVVI